MLGAKRIASASVAQQITALELTARLCMAIVISGALIDESQPNGP